MAAWEALLLGAIQGITEFLPVSSSGHLAIAQRLLPGFRQPGVTFDVALHLGTVTAVVALEWRRLWDAWRQRVLVRLTGQLLLATVATAAIAMPMRARAEEAFDRPLAVAVGLAVTAFLLLVGRGALAGTGPSDTPWWAVLFVGLAQGAAVMPGLSRSGSTIVAGSVTGLERSWTADFSFLISIPAILGAAAVEGWGNRLELARDARAFAAPALIGAVTAALVGCAALLAVRRLVRVGRLHLFAYYLLPLALLVIVLASVGAI
jgi:undecaprenyl-diphosphatase